MAFQELKKSLTSLSIRKFLLDFMPMPRPCPFRPDFGPEGFPPIPKINSDAIRQQVFTHRSYYARPTHIFEDQPNDLSPDNEKLEHLGDTVLALVVTDMMIKAFPGLHVGPSTKIRALVVGNATLADMLPYRLRLHAAQAITLRASTNIQADVFESYVGGLYKDQGLAAVEKWLHPLLLPYAEEAYKFVRKQYGLPETRSSSGTLPTFHYRLHRSPGPQLPSRQISSGSSSGTASPPESESEPGSLSPATQHGGLDMEEESIPQAALAIGHLALFNQQLQKANLDIEWVYTEDGDIGMEGLLGAFDPSGTPGDLVHIVGTDDPAPGARGITAVNPVVKKATRTTPMWTVKAFVNGEMYGSGKGTSKKAARHVAAKEGLQRLGINVW
ncbi:hypothetical protein CCMSSC00406_0001181 [Pleurotus cornucopiae]|uniref:Uncharacterized protein n=1 Tax=Pleurotus cornucopiae TaxID=5321 RepID=A0ACB7IKV2_PLECO|nr:hypothetical protein CCMSSC00406_0001181 [Pleurotus cornucopiae]